VAVTLSQVSKPTDAKLLQEYAETGSESAFAELVRRHANLVYSAAFRLLGDRQLAEDVTQTAFAALAAEAAKLAGRRVVAGWLYTTARNMSANVIRRESRRRSREQESAAMTEGDARDDPGDWNRLERHLDDIMGELAESDRDALALRYFSRQSIREIAATLDSTEAAAQKRVNRAVEKLRRLFSRRGIEIGASALVGLIAAHATKAAPANVAAIASQATGGTVAVVSTKIIVMSTAKKIVVGVALVAAVGTGIHQGRLNRALRAENESLRREREEAVADRASADEASAVAAAALAEAERVREASSTEVARLRSKVAKLQERPAAVTDEGAATGTVEVRQPASAEDGELPRDSWSDAGFATPVDALRTRGWSVIEGHRERFRESVHVTPGARKRLEDMFVEMMKRSNAPNKAEVIRTLVQNEYGVEEGLLMPMMADDRRNGLTGYRIVSRKDADNGDALLEVETSRRSAPSRTETLKLRRFEGQWKVVIDEALVDSMTP